MPHVIQNQLPILYTQDSQILIHRIPAATDNIVYLIEYELGSSLQSMAQMLKAS